VTAGTRTVLHLRNSDRLGGPERLLLDQAARAPEDLAFVLASFGQEGAPHAFLDEARRRGLTTALVPQKGSYDLGLTRRVADLVAAVGADLVVGHDYKANLLLKRATKRRRLPRVAVVHGYTGEDLKVRLFEALDRRGLKHADLVVAVSEATAEVARRAGVPGARIARVENGVDVEAVREAALSGRRGARGALGASDDDLVLLCLGRLSPEKGQRVLLEALRDVRLAGAAHLVVALVGDGPERPALEALARGDARVRFLGWRDDPHRWLGAADLFVLPSLSEGLPVALLEALAVGLPCVATSVGGVPAALEGAGLLVPPGVAHDMAAALAPLLASPAERTRLAALARARAARFGADRQASALADLYRTVLGPARSSDVP
jgi:glycosyltransferase involved in cell wall biosynthesis